MSDRKDPDSLERAIVESLRRSFSPPSPTTLAEIGERPKSSPARRSGRPLLVAALVCAAALVLWLRLAPETRESGSELSAAWLQRWEEMVTAPSELRACTVVDSPIGLLSAARTQLGLQLESEVLRSASAPEARVQRLDDTQGVQLVVGDHAYLFFAQIGGDVPDRVGFADAGLRVTMRLFDGVRLFEVAGRDAPEVLPTLRLVGE